MASLKEGYGEEYKSTCLVLAFAIVLFSPNLVSWVCSYIPNTRAPLDMLACYAAFLAFVYVIGITIDALVPYSLKEFLLYPSFNDRGLLKPGCSIFTKINRGKSRDFRLNIAKAQKRYAEIINQCQNKKGRDLAEYQNATWYSLYQKYASSASVVSNNRSYLYCRDVFLLAFTLVVIELTCNIVFGVRGLDLLIGWPSVFIPFVLAAASWLSAHFKARRLAFTVIACDLAFWEGEGK